MLEITQASSCTFFLSAHQHLGGLDRARRVRGENGLELLAQRGLVMRTPRYWLRNVRFSSGKRLENSEASSYCEACEKKTISLSDGPESLNLGPRIVQSFCAPNFCATVSLAMSGEASHSDQHPRNIRVEHGWTGRSTCCQESW